MLQSGKVGKSSLTDDITSSGQQIGNFVHGGVLSSDGRLVCRCQLSGVSLGLGDPTPRFNNLLFAGTDVSVFLDLFLRRTS